MEIYVHRGRNEYGPYSKEEIREFLAAGNFTVDDLCRSSEAPTLEAIQSRLDWFLGDRYRSEPINLMGLDSYYQVEFMKIYLSHEKYKGSWNWDAFLSGGLWAIAKGLWLSLIMCVVLGFLTCGFVWVVYWFIYGARGNYIYYCAYVKRRQLPF